MTENKAIAAEKAELNLLINKGVNIEIERTIEVRPSGLIWRFRKPFKKTEKLQFTIQEPTLSTLDRIAAEQIELDADERELTSSDGLQAAKKLASKHSKRMARIVAIAVIGNEYVKAERKGDRIIYTNDDARLNELAELFYHNIKPSKLLQYCLLVNTIANLGDFTNSIRLMSASRTTMPILIEQKD